MAEAAVATVVKEGMLFKRGNWFCFGLGGLDDPNSNFQYTITLYLAGEYIKNWRRRYFVLLSDGRFLGYKFDKTTNKPAESQAEEPLNNFTVKGRFFCVQFTS